MKMSLCFVDSLCIHKSHSVANSNKNAKLLDHTILDGNFQMRYFTTPLHYSKFGGGSPSYGWVKVMGLIKAAK